MNASDVYVKFFPGNDQWGVCGANLPAPAVWALHDEQYDAMAAAQELASDFGVDYVGVKS